MEKFEKELILMVGCIGSGKSTFAKYLENDVSVRINQDENGKSGHLAMFKAALGEEVPRIIIDRMNFNKEQRARYIEPARANGYIITVFEMDTPLEVCHDRVVNRFNHPTVEGNNSELAMKILNFYENNYEPVIPSEYDNYNLVANQVETDKYYKWDVSGEQ